MSCPLERSDRGKTNRLTDMRARRTFLPVLGGEEYESPARSSLKYSLAPHSRPPAGRAPSKNGDSWLFAVPRFGRRTFCRQRCFATNCSGIIQSLSRSYGAGQQGQSAYAHQRVGQTTTGG